MMPNFNQIMQLRYLWLLKKFKWWLPWLKHERKNMKILKCNWLRLMIYTFMSFSFPLVFDKKMLIPWPNGCTTTYHVRLVHTLKEGYAQTKKNTRSKAYSFNLIMLLILITFWHNKVARGLEGERLSRLKEGVRIFRLNASFTSLSI